MNSNHRLKCFSCSLFSANIQLIFIMKSKTDHTIDVMLKRSSFTNAKLHIDLLMEHKTFRSKAPGYTLFCCCWLVAHLAKMAMGAHECAVLLHFINKRFFNAQNQKSLKSLSLFSRQRSKHSIHRYSYVTTEKNCDRNT